MTWLQVLGHPRPERSRERRLGPVHDLLGEPRLGGTLQCDLSGPAGDLVLARQSENAARKTIGVHEGNAYLGRCGHAGPVRVGEVEAGEEHPGVGQAHAVDPVRQVVVLVDLLMLLDDVVDVALQTRGSGAPPARRGRTGCNSCERPPPRAARRTSRIAWPTGRSGGRDRPRSPAGVRRHRSSSGGRSPEAPGIARPARRRRACGSPRTARRHPCPTAAP